MCNIVNTRFLRPFGVIMGITTKSPQKLYNRSSFGPFFTQKSFCFLRPFGVIMEITTKSPQKLYNGSFFGPFFTQKSFFSPLKSF